MDKLPNLSNRDEIEITTLVACGWILASILAGFVAIRTGLSISLTAEAVCLAILPPVTTLLLAPLRQEGWARAVVAYSWVALAGVAVAATGGFDSPLAVMFLVGPAITARLCGAACASEAAFFALIGYGVAGALAGEVAPLRLGALAVVAGGASIVAAGLLIAAVARTRAAQPPPAPLAAPAPVANDEGERALREASALIAAHRRRTAELAHELRTPLNHILGFADVMRQRLFGPLHDRYGEYIELIHTSGRNLLDLVNGLLDLSRLEDGKYPLEVEPFDFRAIAEEVVALAQHQAKGKSIALALEADAALPVRADARALRQILTNLLANALKFTPANGAVTVRALARDGALVLEVEDSGPGIPVAERARLAKPFERGAMGADTEGYGLGLSLVRAFAALHDGELRFASAPSGGALVSVALPVLRA